MAGKPIATLGSMHTCPMVTGYIPHVGGPVVSPCAPNVLINGKPAALMGDMCVCVGPPDMIAQGEPTVLINGTPVATQGSMTAHGGMIIAGEPTVMVSTATPSVKATMPIKKIPFPKINILQKIKASVVGKADDLKTAQQNQEQVKKDAEEQDTLSLSNMVWKCDGNEITTAIVGAEVCLCADVSGADEGDTISLKIYDKDKKGENDYLGMVQGKVENGSVNINWNVKYMEDNDDVDSEEEQSAQGYTTPEYIFTGSTNKTQDQESSVLEVKGWFKVQLKKDNSEEVYANTKYILYLPDGTEEEGTTDENGYIDRPETRLGQFEIALKEEETEESNTNE